MSFYRSKEFWIASVIFAPLLLLGVNYGVKVMTSVFKKDLGNGVVIYADDYVKSGLWVFDCKYRRLISRKPLPVPIAELVNSEKLPVQSIYILDKRDEVLAKEVVRKVTEVSNWYQELSYLYSVLGENSELSSHTFYLITRHEGRLWAVEIDQEIRYGRSHFSASARPYDPYTYVDYPKALMSALTTCPVLQHAQLPLIGGIAWLAR
ncbi:hypothetical protein [Pseudomonas sp. NA-150]|uniref:hypothetical protein n=1 Tax=Pseudomonas sp. NA-150 TaxID=3367525 RepID=UPI0037C88D56